MSFSQPGQPQSTDVSATSGFSASEVQDVRGATPKAGGAGYGELLPAAFLIWVVGVALMVWRFRYAPEGYQDEAGFHYGKEGK